jgi:pimeloyl-ACP methyl ester carboxylesterase
MEQERFIKSHDGTDLFTSTMGHGQLPMVLCDGLGCDGFIWKYLKPAFAPHVRLLRWNYRGHGLSGRPLDPHSMTMNHLISDFLRVLDAHGVDKAVLVGHSLGVQLILDMALQHPDRVAALVPVCGSYGRPLDTLHNDGKFGVVFPYLRNAMLKFPGAGQKVWGRIMRSSLSFKFTRTFEVNGRVLKPGDLEPYFEHLAGMDATLFMRLLDDIRNHTVEEGLMDIRTPTLIIAGERDTFTPAWLSHRMHELIPGSELLVVPGGSHIAPIEIPELIHLRVHQFLEDKGFLKEASIQEEPVVVRKPVTRRKTKNPVQIQS